MIVCIHFKIIKMSLYSVYIDIRRHYSTQLIGQTGYDASVTAGDFMLSSFVINSCLSKMKLESCLPHIFTTLTLTT